MGKIEAAVNWITAIANDNSHGYDQGNRWGNPDYDCSSLVISAWQAAGVPVKTAGATNTRDMFRVFTQCGFKDVKPLVNLSTGAGLKPGDVLLNSKTHTEMVVNNGLVAGAHENEFGQSTNGQKGDQTGHEIDVKAYVAKTWEYVLRYMGEDGGSTGGDTTGTPTLSLGSKGSEVKKMQRKLMLLGYSCGASGADGDFGSGTQTAVRNFQSANGLAADGICGPATHTKIKAKYKALNVFIAVCNLEGLKVRTGNGTNHPIFSAYPSLKKGEEVKVGKVTSNNWYFVLVGNRYTAYVAAKYMKKK